MSEPIDPGLIKLLLTLLVVTGLGVTFLNFPGIILIFLAALICGWSTNFTDPTINAIIIAGLITLLSFGVDNLAMLLGAKKLGASNWGMLGATLGGILGLFVAGPIGVILGPLVGAVIAEMIVNPHLKNALKSGLGTFIGYLFGMFLKIIITISLFIWVLTVIW